MRAVHVISGIDPSAGGTATALAALVVSQRVAGLDVSVVTSFLNERGVAGAALREKGVGVVEVGPCRPPLQGHPEMASVLGDQIARADIVHIHGMWEEIQHRAARVSQKFGVPYVITPHGMLDPWSLSQSPWRKKIYLAVRMRRNLNRAAAIHFTSATERDLAVPLGLRAETLVEPNGIDLSEFSDLPSAGAFRAKHPSLRGRRIALFLGRVHPKKGLDLLIPALAQSQLGDVVLVIAGPDNTGYLATVKESAEREGVIDQLLPVGMLRGRDRIEAMVDADLFVLPSYQENFGIAVVEALAAGCPVLISDQVNIHQAITAAGVGGVVPTKVQPLAAELKRWMSNASQRRQASSAAPRFVREQFDQNVIAQRWLGHYARLASQGRIGDRPSNQQPSNQQQGPA